MAKKDNDNNNLAEDYLAQLDWKTRHRRRSSVHYEPKWRYKISYKEEAPTSYFPLIIFSIITIVVFIFLLYLIFFEHSFGAIFGMLFFILLTTILFFAIRDAEHSPKNDDDDEN